MRNKATRTASSAAKRHRKSSFASPLWHWTLHWSEHRRLGPRGRQRVDKVLRKSLVLQLELPSGLSFCGRSSLLACSRASRLRQQRLFGESFPAPGNQPSHWLGLGHAFPDPKALRVNLDAAELRYWMLVRNERGPFIYGARRIDLKRMHAHHDFLVVARGQRGQGIAAQALANAVDLYRSLGVRRIHLVAGLSAGSSVWPKLGFRPKTVDDWKALRHVVLRNLAGLDPAVPGVFQSVHGRSLLEAVNAAVSSSDPMSIFDLMDIDPGDGAARSVSPRLEHGLAAELLRGGHWAGVLELDGDGGQRMEDYLRERAAGGRVDLRSGWARI